MDLDYFIQFQYFFPMSMVYVLAPCERSFAINVVMVSLFNVHRLKCSPYVKVDVIIVIG